MRAHGGTIFLDEVGELDEVAQPRLLRAIERREVKPEGGESFESVDVRVVAATIRDLLAEVRSGRFRSDLYHRLAVVFLELPPPRERREDIPLLVGHLARELATALGRPTPEISAEATEVLCRYDWPGNIRELRNVLHVCSRWHRTKTSSTANICVSTRHRPGRTCVRRRRVSNLSRKRKTR